MSLPLYGTEAHGGRIITMDDEAVMKDLEPLVPDDSGNAIVPYIVSSIFDRGNDGGYSKLRRNVQHVHADGAVTVTTTPYKDQQESGNAITDTIAVGGDPIVIAPINESGTNFQVKIALSSYDAATELGKGEQWVIPRRSER